MDRLRSTTKRNAIAIAVMALVLAVLYVVIRVVLMVTSLQATMDEVKNLQAAATSKDLASISIGLGRATDAISMAESSANDPMVQLLAMAPVIGNDIKAAGVIATDGKLVLQGAQEVSSVANQLVISGIGKEPMTDSALIASMRNSITAMNEAVQKLNTDLAEIDPSTLHFGLDSKIKSAKDAVGVLATASTRITPIVQVGTLLLEQPEQKRWFIAIQNLAESRATGGITGAYAILVTENGQVKLEEYGSDKKLFKMGRIKYQSYPKELRDIWGVDLTDWRDINASAHAPYAAQLLADGWQQLRGEQIDGVLFVGQGIVSELSGAVGPIEVRGVTVDPTNVIDFLAKDIYAKFTKVYEKDAVVGELAKQMFQRLVDGKISATGFLKSAVADNTGDRIIAWAQNLKVQEKFASYKLSGEVSDKFGPNVLVTVNNAGGNKLEAYASLSINYAHGQCNVDTFTGFQGRRSSVTMEVTNGAPSSGLPAYVVTRLDADFGEDRPKGSNRELITVYGPVGSEAESATINGEAAFVSTGVDRNRPIWVFDIQLLPGETKTLVINLVEPINDNNLEKITGKPVVTPPVMLNAAKITTSSTGECKLK